MTLLGVAVLGSVVSFATALEVFVSPDGDDGAAGTKGAPVATWEHALALVRGAKGATVTFRGGTYVLDETVTIGPEDSGHSSTQPTVFRSFPGESAVFKSGARVEGWRQLMASDVGYSTIPKSARSSVLVASLPVLLLPRFLADNSQGDRRSSVLPDTNVVYGKADARQNTSSVWYVGQTDSLKDCQHAVTATQEPEAFAYAWHSANFPDSNWAKGCYARVDVHSGSRAVAPQNGVTSGFVASATWQRQAHLEISDLIATQHHTIPDTELLAPPDDKRRLKLSTSVLDVIGDEQPADSLDVKVIESDFNMGVLPIQGVDGSKTLVTSVPAAFRMGRLDSIGYISDDSTSPSHWLVNSLKGLDGPGTWAALPGAQGNGQYKRITDHIGTESEKYHTISDVAEAEVASKCQAFCDNDDSCGQFMWDKAGGKVCYFWQKSSSDSHEDGCCDLYVKQGGEQGGQLFYWPATDASDLDVWVPSLSELVRVEGKDVQALTGDVPVKHLEFQDLTFTGGDRYCWGGKDQGGIQHDYAVLDGPTSLLRLRTASDISIKGCSFAHSGGGGIRMDLLAKNNTISECKFAHLGLEAVGIFGYGAGLKDVSQGNSLQHSEIHRIGNAKFDAPAVVLWHTAFNNIISNYVHHTPSKAVFVGGMRGITFDPEPLGGATTIHEAGWQMARWDEIGQIVKIGGTEDATTYTPEIYQPTEMWPVERTCAKYRYTRGNLIQGNLFRHIHSGQFHPFSFFGDGVIYLSGVGQINDESEANAIIENVFASNPGDYGLGVHLLEQVYADGFGGMVRIERNAFVNGNEQGVMQLCTWYDRSPVEANVFFETSQIFLNLNCDGNEVVLPKGNLHLDDTGDDYHQPSNAHLADYGRVHDLVCQMGLDNRVPGAPLVRDLPGVAGLLVALSAQIQALGGTAHSSCATAANAQFV